MKRFLLVLLVILVLAIPIQAQETIYLPIITKDDSCMGIAKLAISDGTTEISLLDLNGIHLAEDDGWTPKIIQAKGGGVFQDSSMAAGRRLVYRQFGTAREDFTFNIMGISEDDLIAETSDLLMMLEKAVNYWATDWQSDIVYLIAQSDCETYARYAPILYYEAPELQNPYGQPFIQNNKGAIFDDIGIMIERGHWQSTIPGTGDCAENSSVQSWLYSTGWSVNTGLPADFVRAMIQAANGYIFAGDTGQILRSTDDGSTWAVNTALPAAEVYSFLQLANGDILAGDTGQILRTQNNGGAWAVLPASPAVSAGFSMIQLANSWILIGDEFQIWRSKDNAASWNTVTTAQAGQVNSLVQLANGDILAGDRDQIWRSQDNGDTWEIISTLQTDEVFALIQLTTGDVLAGDNHNPGSIWRSEDNGVNWFIVQSPPNGFVFDIIQTQNGDVYASQDGQIWKSVNNGISFFVETTDPVNEVYSLLQTANGSIYAGEEGQIWRKQIPNTDMGASDTCDTSDIVYVANKQNIANLTNIFINDGGVFSTIFPMTLPDDLLPAVPAVNDAIYFGIDTSIDNSGPFSSLVFDIQTAISFTNSYTITWEYWNGAWVALTVNDDTATSNGAFRKTGIHSVHWTTPTDWATTAVNAVTGYWVRARLSALAGSITPPVQQNRNIYSVVFPKTEIEDTAVLGDISSLLQIRANNRSDKDGPGGSAPNLYENRMLVGLRSYDRGNTFQAYLNISDQQTVGDVDISLGTNTTFGNDLSAPTARSATYNPGGVEAMATRATATLSTTIARDFYGSYHAFLRVQRTAGASTDFDIQLVFVTGSGGIQKTTESKQVQTTTKFELLDFGQVTIPVGGSLKSSDLGDQIQILIQASAASGTPNLVLYDLILIPVDEWAIDSVDQTNSSTSDIGRSGDIQKLLDIDSVTDPKNPIKSIVRQVGSNFVTANYNPITNGPAILQSNVDQRLWFLAAKTSATGSSYSWIAPPEICHSVQLYKAQRYLGLRGNR